MKLPFVKMHGLGNDFLVFDVRDLEIDFKTRLAERLCDRHFGIGADGVLLFTGEKYEPTMTVINADGSVPEMCGNGLRCFVKYMADRHDVYGDGMFVHTDAGKLFCEMHKHAGGRVAEVSVAMGTPTFAPGAVPAAAQQPVIDKEIKAAGRYLRITAVGTGNPHGVVFDPFTPHEREAVAPELGSHELFPAGANIEFCRVLSAIDDDYDPRGPTGEDNVPMVQMRCDVYERGCGWTLACGTGATAAVCAAVKLGHIPVESAARGVRVKLPGGWLTIVLDADGAATMTGPATEVFTGEVEVMPRRD